MDHVVAPLADAGEVLLPVMRVLAHELAQNGEDGQCRQGQWRAIQGQAWRYIDVVEGGLLLRITGRGILELGGQLRESCIGDVVSVGAGLVDGDRNLYVASEIGYQPGSIEKVVSQ